MGCIFERKVTKCVPISRLEILNPACAGCGCAVAVGADYAGVPREEWAWGAVDVSEVNSLEAAFILSAPRVKTSLSCRLQLLGVDRFRCQGL